MPNEKYSILAIDDEDSILQSYELILKPAYNVLLADNAKDGLKLIEENKISIVILDMKMPGLSGMEALAKIKEADKNIEVIIVSASHDIKTAVLALKLGAHDFITKPFDINHLLSIIEKTLEAKNISKESDSHIVGKSDEINKVFNLTCKASQIDSTVLITGESGTGKELIANSIHKNSSRRSQPFIVLNCAAIPESLIESELFGHEKGAFTGAVESKKGKFELADNGILFLDEIGCMKPPLQAKLLRVLQNRVVEKIGSSRQIHVNVRIIAATNAPLEEAVELNEFRQDLYYRLNVLRIHLPPLKKRRTDIPLLLEHFLEKYNRRFDKDIRGFSTRALNYLIAYDWPGNVRELQNFVERTAAVLEKDVVSYCDINLRSISKNVTIENMKDAIAEFEKRYIKNALAQSGGNRSLAASLLGIHRTTLVEKIKQLKITLICFLAGILSIFFLDNILSSLLQ